MGLSLVPFLAAPAAQAAGTITGTVSPVRFTGTAGSFETSVPAAAIAWPIANSNVFSGSPSIYFDGTTAASPSLNVYDAAGTSVVSTISVLDDTPIIASNMGASGDDSFIRIKVNTAGTYTGKIANGSDTVSWTFTTTGAASSIVLTPATQSTLVGGTADLTAALLDSAGNPTQPTTSSLVTLATSGAGGTLSAASLSASDLALGSADFTVSGMASGSTTVTATGAGDLLTQSATASITASGSVSDDTVAGMAVTSPTTGVWNGTAWPSAVAQVKAGTSSVTVTVDDTTVNSAGETIRLAAWVSAGTVNGEAATSAAPIYVDVVTDANKQATATFTLGAGALLPGETLTVQQANVTDVLKTNINLTVSQVTPVVTNSTVTISPSGSNVRKLGDSTNVVVTADDSLGDPVAGLQVLAYRTSATAANLLSSGVTGADGSATVAVTSSSSAVAGTTESYVFTVATVGTLSSPNTLSIEYTADGKIDTLSVAPGSASTFDAAGSATVTTYPVISVPTTTGLVGTSNSTGVYTISSEATSGTVSPLLAVVISPSPANSSTITVPEGVKVSATAPDSSTLWSAGAQTATVASGGTAYIWSTKTGTHTYTVESGGLTATGTLIVANSANDAYNVGITPATSRVGKGSIFTVTLTLTDMFGNPVEAAGTTSGDDTGALTVTASGEVLLAGFATSNTFATGENGTVSVTAIAGNSSGTGALTVTAKAGTATPAWQTSYEAPTGKSAPVVSAASEVIVSGDAEKTITIVGSRTTVKGKPGIMIDGVTTGIEDGKTVVPYFRFPGQTEYTQGSARPEVNDDEFTWQRKTGKKFYAYVTNDDGAVKSNRVIIPAK